MHRTPAPLLVVTGYALIVLPLVALILKTLSFGWMMVFLLFGPILLLAAGYALQIVIAARVFISPRETVWPGGSQQRITIAAWITSLALVVLAVFMPDGGDSSYGSTFQVLLGANDRFADRAALHAATDDMTALVALIALLLWLGGFVWLFVEWMVLLAARKQARPAGPMGLSQPGNVRYAPPPDGTPHTGL